MGRKTKKQIIGRFHMEALDVARKAETFLIERGKEITEAAKKVLERIEFPPPALIQDARELFGDIDPIKLSDRFYNPEDEKESYRRQLHHRFFRVGSMLRIFATDYEYAITVIPFQIQSGGCHAIDNDGKLYSIIASPEDMAARKYKYLTESNNSPYFVWSNWQEIMGLLERALNCQPKQIAKDLEFFKKHTNLISL